MSGWRQELFGDVGLGAVGQAVVKNYSPVYPLPATTEHLFVLGPQTFVEEIQRGTYSGGGYAKPTEWVMLLIAAGTPTYRFSQSEKEGESLYIAAPPVPSGGVFAWVPAFALTGASPPPAPKSSSGLFAGALAAAGVILLFRKAKKPRDRDDVGPRHETLDGPRSNPSRRRRRRLRRWR